MCPQLLNTLGCRCFNSELDNERIESLHLSIYFGTIASKNSKCAGQHFWDSSFSVGKKYLNLTDNDFLMRAEQIAYLGNGHIFEYSIANHIPSEFTFETVLIAEK